MSFGFSQVVKSGKEHWALFEIRESGRNRVLKSLFQKQCLFSQIGNKVTSDRCNNTKAKRSNLHNPSKRFVQVPQTVLHPGASSTCIKNASEKLDVFAGQITPSALTILFDPAVQVKLASKNVFSGRPQSKRNFGAFYVFVRSCVKLYDISAF